MKPKKFVYVAGECAEIFYTEKEVLNYLEEFADKGTKVYRYELSEELEYRTGLYPMTKK